MRQMQSRAGWTIAAAMTTMLLAARPSAATDGVIEINQARALAGGVTAADTPGFPVTIKTNGSYRLTSDLVVPDESTTAIQVTNDTTAVSIDLNGFAIVGPVHCTSSPTAVTCTPTGGLGKGIEATGSFGTETLYVHDGAIRGMGLNGLVGTSRIDLVERVHAENNRGIAIYLGPGALVVDSSAQDNGSTGIVVGDGSVVRGSSAIDNGGYGIFVGSGTVVQSVMRGNVNYGLTVSNEGGYGENDISLNRNGVNPQVNGGFQIGINVCGGDTTCP